MRKVGCHFSSGRFWSSRLRDLNSKFLSLVHKEPPPKDYPLRSLPNVIMQPHMGGYTEEGYGWKFVPAVENIIAFIEGRPQNLATEKDIERQRQRQMT